MNNEIRNLSVAAHRAVVQQDWATVDICANGILQRAPGHIDGLFLYGLVQKAAERPKQAVEAFEAVLAQNSERYDAAIELASQYSVARRNEDVLRLISHYADAIQNSPKYLNLAGTVYTEIGLPEKAWPLFQKANELQPGTPLLQANLASCAVYVGEIDTARVTYRELLAANPNHQRNHYQLARLVKTKDRDHIDEMEGVLKQAGLPPDRNIFLYVALGKEYEDLGDWDKAFEYFKRAGDAVSSVANYDIADDIAIIDTIIDVCDEKWLRNEPAAKNDDKTPLFIVGLPRTGTTLTERIIASHSRVESVGETEFLQMVIRRESGVAAIEKMTPEMIRTMADKSAALVRDGYLNAIRYRLHDQPIFIDKLPFNILYLGFIAKAWPDAPIVLLQRDAMDACFSMYKQVFTWAYKYSYQLDSLAEYYIAYDRLCQHWTKILGERLVTIKYEELVSEQEAQTRRLLAGVGLDFEEACLNFEKNAAPSATASSVQVRQKVHTGSVGRWRRYEEQLEPLRRKLEAAGIRID